MVIACGGDGTNNEIVNGLAGSNVPMAVLPAGTANILAKELGIPWDIPQAARLISGGAVRRVALGVTIPAEGRHTDQVPAEGRYFLCAAGAGPDGAIVNGVDGELKKKAGILAYWLEGMHQVLQVWVPGDARAFEWRGAAGDDCRRRADCELRRSLLRLRPARIYLRTLSSF